MQQSIFIVHCFRIKKQGRYEVYFSINDQLIERIKKLPSQQRTWNTYKRCWELTTKGLYTIIKIYKNSNKIKFEFDDRKAFVDQIKKIDADEKEKERLLKELVDKKENWLKLKQQLDDDYKKYWDKVHSPLKGGITLYPHQVTASIFLNQVKNALISHEMGLGKTLSAIAYVEMNDFEKVFVITPNSLKFNFYYEVEKFTNSKAHIINWKKNIYSIEEAKYVIVNYEFFNPKDSKKMDKKFKGLGIEKIDCLIADECHRIKSTKSNTYKNFKRIFKDKIFKNKSSKVFLSGTPAPNRAYELYTVLNQISPLEFQTKDFFYKYYLGMEYDSDAYGGWSKNPTKENLEQLYNNIAPYTHRKKKEDVLKDLPDKIYQKIILEFTPKQKELYNEIEQGIANEFINEEIENPLTIMLRLRQYTASLKNSIVIEFIDRLLDEGEKVVIVDYFKESLGMLKEYYQDIACLHTGDFSVDDRAMMVKEFQNPDSEIKIFLGSIPTTKEGLTLTQANKIFLLTLPYSVGEFDQVIDRLHRIGQKDTVNAYFLIFEDSIDEYVFNAVEAKRAEISKIMDNENYQSDVYESVMSEVMNKILEKHDTKNVV